MIMLDATIVNNSLLLGIAIITAYTAYRSSMNSLVAKQALEITKKTEVNTNSMKDELVSAAAKKAYLEGLKEGTNQEKARTAELVLDKLKDKLKT